jgi:hypothetical protein
MIDERDQAPHAEATERPGRVRVRWERPTIVELPKLTDLTLLTGAGIPGGGGTGGSGSTVF